MADLTIAPVLSVRTTINSKLSDLPLEDGQLIFIRDKQSIALDFGGKRKLYKQIEELATEEIRTSMLTPVTGLYYFVIETGVLWTYRDGWVQITTPPIEISNIEQSAKDYSDSLANVAAADATSKANKAFDDAKAYADEIGKYVTGTVDENGDVIIMLDERIFNNLT